MKLTKTRRGGLVAAVAALAFLLAACSGGGDKSGGTVTLGILPSWTDGLATAYLWKNILESEGYDVEITELSEAAPLYTGLASGDIDVYPSAWSEATHAEYMNKYGDDIEDLGTYYDEAKLTIAVPEYTEIESIEDLKKDPDRFDGKIIGIEPGAGLTRVTKEDVIPDYKLSDDYKLVESSTTAMLAELKSAIADKRDIVVTLWRPFWANTSFPVKDLKDPKGALGKPEGLHTLSRAGFSDDMPEVTDMMKKFKLTDEQYGDLENMVVNDFGEGKEAEAVEAWLKKNPDFKKTLTD